MVTDSNSFLFILSWNCSKQTYQNISYGHLGPAVAKHSGQFSVLILYDPSGAFNLVGHP